MTVLVSGCKEIVDEILPLPSTYRLTYDKNGATSGTVPEDNKVYFSGGYAVVLKPVDLEKDGHAFIFWNTKQDGTGTDYQPGAKLHISSTTNKLFAQWKE